jgi:hypothetical protein
MYQRTQRMIIEESKCRLLNKDEESVESVSIPLIMRSHLFLHQIRFEAYLQCR